MIAKNSITLLFSWSHANDQVGCRMYIYKSSEF